MRIVVADEDGKDGVVMMAFVVLVVVARIPLGSSRAKKAHNYPPIG